MRKIKMFIMDKDMSESEHEYEGDFLDSFNQAQLLLAGWLKTKDFNSSVFLCFEAIPSLPVEEQRNNHLSMLMSHSYEEIMDFAHRRLSSPLGCSLAMFECKNYLELLDLVKELKQL